MAGSGTGQPISFHCSKCRRGRPAGCADWNFQHGFPIHCSHKQVRTGRTRPDRSNRGGPRVLREHHEYRCQCGHVGWSRHVDVLRLPLETP